MERDLKEEKIAKKIMRDRLSRAENQAKIGLERATKVEAALEQARFNERTLERTVQQLHDEVVKLNLLF